MKQQQVSTTKQNSNLLELINKQKTNTNIDCIKVCPMDAQLWAIVYYQQDVVKQGETSQQSFQGGIQVLQTNLILQQRGSGEHNAIFGTKAGNYLKLGPIMHAQWLDTTQLQLMGVKNLSSIHYIMAAHRCNQALIISYNTQNHKLQLLKSILLGQGIFCLYCDWRLKISAQKVQSPEIKTIAAVSTNQSAVYCFQVKIVQKQSDKQKIDKQILIGQITQLKKHQYAVWACKINNSIDYLVLGDQLSTLYLYAIEPSSITLKAKNSKVHTQGVCQLIWLDNIRFMSGSFDGSFAQICVDKMEVMRKWQVGGTVWRIIQINQINHSSTALKQKAIRQYNKQVVLLCNSSEKKFQLYNLHKQQEIWNSGSQHNSLAYAGDFNGQYFLSASFYDQQIRVWFLKI